MTVAIIDAGMTREAMGLFAHVSPASIDLIKKRAAHAIRQIEVIYSDGNAWRAFVSRCPRAEREMGDPSMARPARTERRSGRKVILDYATSGLP
ncbi:hypothetical protein NOVOSPHI9U_560018 [Novosphingobium sp. 9U]|nr:hypothetical protein NOVOSPHI9U_560018 [Novosphingobium sp. 9U]